MWLELLINGIKFYSLCQTDDASMYCLLFSENGSWYEKQEFEKLFDRAKNCNKRIHYDEDTIRTTLTKGQPISATFSQDVENYENYILTLKFKVKIYPFTFIWNLKKLAMHEFHMHLMEPFLITLQRLNEQNIELRNALIKKDHKLFCHQIRGSFSNRATIVTERFDIKKFDEKYADLTLDLNILKQLENQFKNDFKYSTTEHKTKPELEFSTALQLTTEAENQNTTERKMKVESDLETSALKMETKIKVESDATTTALKFEKQVESGQRKTTTNTPYKRRKAVLHYQSSDESSDEKSQKYE